MFKLKFKFIEQNNSSARDPLIELMSNKTGFLQEEDSNLENQRITTLIVSDPEEQNIIGGISLIQRELDHLQEDIRGLIPTGTFNRNYVWECSNLGYSFSSDLSFDPFPSELFSRHFYQSLYEGLVEFGRQNEAGFVIVKLTAETYPPTIEIGAWPYIIEFFPQEFPDNHFYGILPLKGCFYEKYKNNLGILDIPLHKDKLSQYAES